MSPNKKSEIIQNIQNKGFVFIRIFHTCNVGLFEYDKKCFSMDQVIEFINSIESDLNDYLSISIVS